MVQIIATISFLFGDDGALHSSFLSLFTVKQRRRSSMAPVLSSFASLAMIGAIGTSVPDLQHPSSSEDDDDDDKENRHGSISQLLRSVSSESDLSGTVTFSLSPDPTDVDSPTNDTSQFTFDGSSTGRRRSSALGTINTNGLAEVIIIITFSPQYVLSQYTHWKIPGCGLT